MPGAGDLSERLRFEKRAVTADDGYGNVEGAWETQFTCAANIRPRMGGETVIAQRLAANQPVEITVWSSIVSRQIEPHWRAVDTRRGTIYNLLAGANFDQRNEQITIAAVTGVPV